MSWKELLALSVGQIGTGVASAMLSPESAAPFKDIPVGSETLQPVDILGLGLQSTARLGQSLTERAEEPISLGPAVVQPPPIFAGGGLPMPIGVTGFDPAAQDPSLLVDRGRVLRDPFRSLGGFDDAGVSEAALAADADTAVSSVANQVAALFPEGTGGVDQDAEARSALDLLALASQEPRQV